MTDLQTQRPGHRGGADHDVVVVGAGLAGLAAAIEATRAGRTVTVLDARAEIGGRARTATHDGYLLNEGAHALYRTGAAFDFLQREGLEPAGGEPTADRAVAVSLADGIVAPLPVGPLSLLRTPLLRGERLRFGRMFARLNRLDTAALDRVPAAAGVERLVGIGRGAEIIHALLRVATFGNDPSKLSAGVALGQLRESINTPVRYVDGGWQTIVDALRERVDELGGTIRAGAKVESVRERTDAVEIVVGDELHHAAAVVIAAGGPRQVEAMTGVEPAPFARPSTVAALDVGFDTAWGEGPTFAVGLDEPLYLSVHAPLAALAPAGGSLVSVLRYHAPEETPDAEHDRRVCEQLLDRVRPRWREAAAHVSFRPRLLAAHDQPQARRGGLAGRAPVRLEGHARVVIAGDWVGDDGLLADAAIASARTAARAVADVGVAS